MINEHNIEVNKRIELGKKSVKGLRREGKIPGVYYSPTSESSIPIFISLSEFNSALKSGARIFNITVGGNKQNVLFKSVQYHPVTDDILHVDLYGIDMKKPINIKIPINLIGNSVGVVEEGGILNQVSNELEIQCLPSDIPEFIEIDISDLGLGDSMNVGSVTLDGKFSLVTPEDSVVASITHAMKEVETITSEEDETFLDEEGSGEDKKDEPVSDKGEGENKSDETDQKSE